MSADEDWSNGAYIPGGADYPARWAAAAAAFRERVPPEAVAYGEGERQWLDLFRPEGEARGLVVFVHGGYWLEGGRDGWSHLAAGPLAQGWAVALPSYDLCPAVRIGDIARQVATAIDTGAGRVPGPVVLTGHSAGGQLVARVVAPGFGLASRDRVTRVVPISAVADLGPLRATSMNAALRIDAAEAASESPLRLPAPGLPVTVWVGAAERPVFVAQARALAKAWNAGLVVEPERHHFDVVEGLADPESGLTRTVCGAG